MYLVISLIVLYISFRLFQKASGSLSIQYLNIVSWIFYFQLVISSYIASVLVIYKVDHHYLMDGIISDSARFQGWLSVMYIMIAMPLSMMFFNKVFRIKNNKYRFKNFCYKPIELPFTLYNSKWKIYLKILSLISIISIIYSHVIIRHIPIFDLFNKSSEELSVLAISNSRGFTGNQYIRNLFAILLSPILTFVAYVYWKYSHKFSDLIWFFAMLIGTIFMQSFSYSKAGIVQIGLSFLIIHILLNGKVNLKLLIKYGLSGFGVLIILYIMFMGNTDLEKIIGNYNSGITGRMILSQAAATYLSFDIFPNAHPFIGFGSISSLFGFNTERSARIIMEISNPMAIDAGEAGVINTLFVGEAWANFGFIGLLISPLIVGGVVQSIHLFFTSKKKFPLKTALYAYFVFNIPITGGFNDFIYSPTWFMLFVIFGIPYFLFSYKNYSLLKWRKEL